MEKEIVFNIDDNVTNLYDCNETVDAKMLLLNKVSNWFNNSLNSTSLSNGFIGNNTYPDPVFNDSLFDVQGNLLLLNLLMHKKNE